MTNLYIYKKNNKFNSPTTVEFYLVLCDSGSPQCMRMALSSCSALWWAELGCEGGRPALGRGVFRLSFRLQQVTAGLSWLAVEGL